MPAETIALQPPYVRRGPIQVASFSCIDCTQVGGGLARMYEVGVTLLPCSNSLCGIGEGLVFARADPSLLKLGSV